MKPEGVPVPGTLARIRSLTLGMCSVSGCVIFAANVVPSVTLTFSTFRGFTPKE